jgi:CubicO group peptidase (beta-lactamase class C family)
MAPCCKFLFVLTLILVSFYASARDCCAQKRNNVAISSEDLSKFIDGFLPGIMRDEHIPGAVFVFVQNGKVILSRGFGYANLEKKQSVDPYKTIFPIGSISKVFTARALVQLASRNQINLRADVNRYLKKLKVPGTYPQPITGGDLLRHTSGLDEIRPGTQAESPDKILPLADFLKDRLVRVHPPGLITSYSTYGITLAGLLIEEISGESYENYLRENIWKPLQMNRTHIATPSQMSADLAIPYAVEKDTPVKIDYEWYHTIPASSIRGTSADMANFILAHLQCGNFKTSEF